MSSTISSDSRVSSTCFEKPPERAPAPPAAARRARSMYGKCRSPVASSSVDDRDDLRVEDLPDPVADRVVDRLRIELARDRVLHAVDQRQLGVPLPRLVHQPRVLQRHAQAAGERLQQLLVGLAERVLAIDVLQRDQARRLAAGDERDEENRLRALSPAMTMLPYRSASAVHVLVDQQRLARLQHVLREAERLPRLDLHPLAAFEEIGVVQEPSRLVDGPRSCTA